jgi:hypothetical protein
VNVSTAPVAASTTAIRRKAKPAILPPRGDQRISRNLSPGIETLRSTWKRGPAEEGATDERRRSARARPVSSACLQDRPDTMASPRARVRNLVPRAPPRSRSRRRDDFRSVAHASTTVKAGRPSDGARRLSG